MNISELENKICTKEVELKQEILNLEAFLLQNSKEKFQYFDKVSIRIQITFFLICFIFIYLTVLVDVFNIKSFIDFFQFILITSIILFWLYFSYWIISKDLFLNIVYRLFNKGISEKIYLFESKNIEKLRVGLRVCNRNKEAFYLNKNIYNEFLSNRAKLYEEELSFIKDRNDWENNLVLRKIDFANYTFLNTLVEFTEYEVIKAKYWDQIKTNFEYNYRLIESGIKELDNYFKKVENNLESGDPVFVNNTLSYNYLDQMTTQSFENYLKYYSINTETKVSRKRIRVPGIRKNGGNNGYITPLPDKKYQEVNQKKHDTSQHIKNIDLGLQGELFVLSKERERLINNGREDLAKKVKHVSIIEGDNSGYDILSYDLNGNIKKIEVKTTVGSISDDFCLTENEYKLMMKSNQYFIYRVYDFNSEYNIGKVKEIHCTKEMNKLKFDVSMFKVKPNKLLNNSIKVFKKEKV